MRASGEGEKGAHKFMSGLATMHRGQGGANELQAAYEKKLQYQRELGEELPLTPVNQRFEFRVKPARKGYSQIAS